MILKLNDLLFATTSLKTVWVSLLDEVGTGGYLLTGNYLITAFDVTGRVWISSQQHNRLGEGMETQAERLAGVLLSGISLPGVDGSLTIELGLATLDRLVGEYFEREF